MPELGQIRGVKRVILFCCMVTIMPTILIITPLYLRHSVFANVVYEVAESDVFAVIDGISTVFCESQTLKMNTSPFNAFQLKQSPERSQNLKHIKLKKSMTLPDDTLEYWGFYLLKGARVSLKLCSHYDGSRLLVVRGAGKHLSTCGLLEHNAKKFGIGMDRDHDQVKVIFEHAQVDPDVIRSNTTNTSNNSTNRKQDSFKDTNAAIEEFDSVNTFVKTRIAKGRTKLEKVANEEAHKTKDYELNIRHRNNMNKSLKLGLNNDDIEDRLIRVKRDLSNQILDGRIEHGGNALNYSENQDSNENSASSFETDLLTCYDGSILLAQGFNSSRQCTNITYLDRGDHMETVHEVASDDYYYYIFYSDNDIEVNHIHAIFDIYKPTYQYLSNNTDKECLNSSECTFPFGVFSNEIVIVEIPTSKGLKLNEDSISYLVSTCNPRMGVYVIFPIAVVLLILICAFL